MQYVRQPDRKGNKLSFNCLCSDIHLLFITYKLLLIYYTTIINLLSCLSLRVTPKNCQCSSHGQGDKTSSLRLLEASL